MSAQSSSVFAEPQGRWARPFADRLPTATTTTVTPATNVQPVQAFKEVSVVIKRFTDGVKFSVQKVGASSVDSSVHAGQLLSDAVMERDKLVAMIFKSISRFAAEEDPNYRISPVTAKAAVRFFHALGTQRALPKIAPDGEDSLMAVWDAADGALAVVLENDRLHVVEKAGTPQARYFDDLPFSGSEIPEEIRELIPTL